MRRGGKPHDNRRGAVIESSIKLPSNGEILGRVARIAGATKFLVKCTDEKERLCTIPGRLRRAFWIKEADVFIVRPGWCRQTNAATSYGVTA